MKQTTLTHDCREELHKADLRVTPARLGVLDMLEHTEKPVGVSEVIAYLKKQRIPADEVTVFRILNAFSRKGIARPVQFNENKLRYEYADKPAHHHFICEKCGFVSDVTGCAMSSLEREIERTTGGIVKRHALEFFGVCGRCI